MAQAVAGINPKAPNNYKVEFHLPENSPESENLRRVGMKYIPSEGIWAGGMGKEATSLMQDLKSRGVVELNMMMPSDRTYPKPQAPQADEIHIVTTDPKTGTTVEEVVDVSGMDDTPTAEIYIDRKAEETLEKAFMVARNEAWNDIPVNIKLSGATGTGKTSITKLLAAKSGMNFDVFSATTLRERSQWFGSFAPDKKTGNLKYQPSDFIKAVQTPNTLVVLDELNRADAKVLNVLLPLLDDQRRTYDPDSNTEIKVAKGVMFIATTNEGGGDDESYEGTEAFDRALVDRFISIDLPPLPQKQLAEVLYEKKGVPQERATKIAKLVDDVKKIEGVGHVSMRSAVQMARLIEMGLSPTQSARATIPLPQDEGRSKHQQDLNMMVVELFGSEAESQTADLEGFGYLGFAGLRGNKAPTQSNLDKSTQF